MQPENILSNIQDLESYTQQLLQEEDKKQKKQKTKGLNDKIIKFLQEIIQSCEKIENKDDNVINDTIELLEMLDEKYHFDNLLNTGIDFKLYFQYNKAHYLQSIWKLPELSEVLYKMEVIFTDYIDFTSTENFIQNKNIDNDFPCLLNKAFFKKLNYACIYIETLLQHTAVLSQIGEHQKALVKADYCFKIMRQIFEVLTVVFKHLAAVGQNYILLDFQGKQNFQNILSYLSYIKKLDFESITQDKYSWTTDMSQWKINKNKGVNFLIKKIQQQSQVSFNTHKIKNEWSDQFHISCIVKLDDFEDFRRKVNTCVLDIKLCVRFFLMFSCCIFSQAAESRFISNQEIEKEKQKIQKTIKFFQSVSQEKQLQKHPRFIYSEQLHSKALEVVLFGFPQDIKLLEHFISSYTKNYSFDIMTIEEEEENTQSSIKQSEYFQGVLVVENPEHLEEINLLNQKLSYLVQNKSSKMKTDLKNFKTLNSKNISSASFRKKKTYSRSKSKKKKIKNALVPINLLNVKDQQNRNSFTYRKLKKSDSLEKNFQKLQQMMNKKKQHQKSLKKTKSKKKTSIPKEWMELINKMNENIKEYVNQFYYFYKVINLFNFFIIILTLNYYLYSIDVLSPYYYQQKFLIIILIKIMIHYKYIQNHNRQINYLFFRLSSSKYESLGKAKNSVATQFLLTYI